MADSATKVERWLERHADQERPHGE
jgi:hypothetical protein